MVLADNERIFTGTWKFGCIVITQMTRAFHSPRKFFQGVGRLKTEKGKGTASGVAVFNRWPDELKQNDRLIPQLQIEF